MLKFKFERKTTLITLIFVLFLIIAYYTGLASFTHKYLTFITNPVIRTANYISTSLADFISPYLSQSYLQKQNEELRAQLVSSASKNIELELLKQENAWFKKELEFLDDYQYTYVIARLLGQSPLYGQNHILIDRGCADGLQEGLAVTTDQGVIIGKIIKCQDNLSHVRLLNSNHSSLAATVMGETPALGTVHGQHNLNLVVDMLPKDIVITAGDLVATSGLETNIPAGLIVGQVTKIDKVEEKLWQTAVVEPLIDYSSLRLLTIILPPN